MQHYHKSYPQPIALWHIMKFNLDKSDQLKLRNYNYVWSGPDSCKCILPLKVISLISFNLMVWLMVMNGHFDRYKGPKLGYRMGRC